jgi:hypothetical protein
MQTSIMGMPHFIFQPQIANTYINLYCVTSPKAPFDLIGFDYS